MTSEQYRLVGELGKGGFGVVYLIQNSGGSKLALKTVDLRRIPEDYRERAKDEAKLLKALRHRHLVHHVNSYIKLPYLVIITEFCAAGDLDKLVSSLAFDTLPEPLLQCWIYQAASALHYMHTHSPVVLHRDLKPQNIYVTEHGDLRLGDLGLARKLAGPQDFATSQVGTIVYLSPEIINQKPYNSKSDIWSLGCVFHDICGKKGGDDVGQLFILMQVLGGKRPPLPKNYGRELRDVISSMLTKDPHTRPSAAAILATPLIRQFIANPQQPSQIISQFARQNGRTPPKISRDTSRLKGASAAILKQEDILVPSDAVRALADMDQDSDVMHGMTGATEGATRGGAQTLDAMSQNSRFLFWGAPESLDTGNDTFYDSQSKPELGEEHLLLQIQQFQRECSVGLGSEVLEAAYAVIANARSDVNQFQRDLKELLGESKYQQYGGKILRLRALEYGLHKQDQQQRKD